MSTDYEVVWSGATWHDYDTRHAPPPEPVLTLASDDDVDDAVLRVLKVCVTLSRNGLERQTDYGEGAIARSVNRLLSSREIVAEGQPWSRRGRIRYRLAPRKRAL